MSSLPGHDHIINCKDNIITLWTMNHFLPSPSALTLDSQAKQSKAWAPGVSFATSIPLPSRPISAPRCGGSQDDFCHGGFGAWGHLLGSTTLKGGVERETLKRSARGKSIHQNQNLSLTVTSFSEFWHTCTNPHG